jgi:hypothetical protein
LPWLHRSISLSADSITPRNQQVARPPASGWLIVTRKSRASEMAASLAARGESCLPAPTSGLDFLSACTLQSALTKSSGEREGHKPIYKAGQTHNFDSLMRKKLNTTRNLLQNQWRTERGNFEVLTKLRQNTSSVANTSIAT